MIGNKCELYTLAHRDSFPKQQRRTLIFSFNLYYDQKAKILTTAGFGLRVLRTVTIQEPSTSTALLNFSYNWVLEITLLHS